MKYRTVMIFADGTWVYWQTQDTRAFDDAANEVKLHNHQQAAFPMVVAVSREDLIVCITPEPVEFLKGKTIAEAAAWFHESNEAFNDFAYYSAADLASLAEAF